MSTHALPFIPMAMKVTHAEALGEKETSTRAVPYDVWVTGRVLLRDKGTLQATLPKSAALTEEDRIRVAIGQIERLVVASGFRATEVATEERGYVDEDDGIRRRRVLVTVTLHESADTDAKFSLLDTAIDYLAAHADPLVRKVVSVNVK